MSAITTATTPIPPKVIYQEKPKPRKSKKAQAPSAITYTAKEFAELFRAQDEVKFPANTKITILHIDPLLALKVQLAETGDPKFEKLIKVFEEVLLLEAKTVTGIKSISQKEFKYTIYMGTGRRNASLTMHARKEFSLSTERGEIHTTIDRLFAKMQYEQAATFTVEPKQLLTLHKVPKTVIKAFLTLNKKPLITCADFLSLSSPPNYAFSFQTDHLQSDFYHSSGKRLTISDDNGIKILLSKAPN